MAGPTGIRSRVQQRRELVADNELQLSALDQASLAITITGPIPQRRDAKLWIASSQADLHAWSARTFIMPRCTVSLVGDPSDLLVKVSREQPSPELLQSKSARERPELQLHHTHTS